VPRRREWPVRSLWVAVGLGASTALSAGCGATPPGHPVLPAVAPHPLPTLDPSEIARGRQVYLQQCASCHGQNAEGAPQWQEPDARGDLPAPPHDDTGHTWRHSDAQLAEIIREGLRDPFNATTDLTMPPFQDRLTDAQIAAVIVYFKSLWSPEHRRFQEEQNERGPMATPRNGS
jgi:mono/diheme cytochrome c family protein